MKFRPTRGPAVLELPFGVLPWQANATGKRWRLAPVSDYLEVMKRWRDRGSDKDWSYPPIVHVGTRWSDDQEVETILTGTTRAASQWQVPATHILEFTATGNLDPNEARHGIGAFLVYLLGTIYGVELQHQGWFVLNRQRKTINGLFLPTGGSLDALLEHADSWFVAQT